MSPTRLVAMVLAGAVAVAVPSVIGQQATAKSEKQLLRIGTSVEGRAIVARRHTSPDATLRVLVVGSVRGGKAAGHRVVHDLRTGEVPAHLDLWTVRTVDPDRGRVGPARRARSHEVGLQTLHQLVADIGPDVVVLHQQQGETAVSGIRGSASVARSMARTADLPLRVDRCEEGCADLADWAAGERRALVRFGLPERAGSGLVARAASAVRSLEPGSVPPDGEPRPTASAPASTATPTPGATSADPSSQPTTTRKPRRPRNPPPPTTPGPTKSPTAKPTPSPTPTTTPTTPTPPPPPPTNPSGGPFLPYTSNAYFRSQVLGASIDSSATSSFRAFMRSHPDQSGTPYPVIRGVGGNNWGTAYAEGNAGDPVWRLTGSVPSEVAVLKSTGFHAPEWFGAMLTGTSDSPFVVVDRASGWSIWGAKSRVVGNHVIEVGAAGLYEHRSNGLDRRNPRSDSALNFRSRGAIPDAMVIRRDLVDHAVARGGDLGHVLHVFMAETSSAAGHVHPMVGSESDKHGWGAEGARIAIDPSIDLSTRGLSPEALVVARTLQRYGAYIGDNAGGPTSLKAEQENGVRPVWNGRLRMDSLRTIGWDDFVVVANS